MWRLHILPFVLKEKPTGAILGPYDKLQIPSNNNMLAIDVA
jgi:hypothetical protein